MAGALVIPALVQQAKITAEANFVDLKGKETGRAGADLACWLGRLSQRPGRRRG